jgi:hypothetical protein
MKSFAACEAAVAFSVMTLGDTTSGSSTYRCRLRSCSEMLSSCSFALLISLLHRRHPHSDVTGRDHAVNVQHVAAGRVDLNLRADLDARNQILMHDRIEEEARPHGVGCEKQVVAIQESHGNRRFKEITEDRINVCLRVRFQDVPACKRDLLASETTSEAA